MCTQIGAKNEFIFYPHGVKNEKNLVHYLPHFHSKIAPTLSTCLCCSNWFMIHRNSTVVALHPNVCFMVHFRSGTTKTYFTTNVLRNLKNVLQNFFRYTCTQNTLMFLLIDRFLSFSYANKSNKLPTKWDIELSNWSLFEWVIVHSYFTPEKDVSFLAPFYYIYLKEWTMKS